MRPSGTQGTKEYYDRAGWVRDAEGATEDRKLFGVKEDGPIRQRIFARKWERIETFISSGLSSAGHVLEVGCGGAPERNIIDRFDHYTGVDFSETGLEVSRSEYEAQADRVQFQAADAVNLPFEEASFDCVYSAHMIYHIVDPAAQASALDEMKRVLKPGGCLILQTANPRPILFPGRLMIRFAADAPGLGALARRLKAKSASPVPYNPRPIGWTLKQFQGLRDLQLVTGGIFSTSFNHSVTENRGLGKLLWQFFDFLDARYPTASAYLGNYAVVMARKPRG